MTDRTHPEAGSTHIIRYALEMGLLWIDGSGRDKVREALDALDALEAKLAFIGAGGVQALSAAPAEVLGWIHEDELPESYPYSAMFPHSKVDTVRVFPVFGPQAASPTPPAEQRAATKAAPVKACVCGEPQAPGTVHRVDGPCYVAAPQQEAQGPSKAYAWVYVNKYGVDSIPASKDWCATMVSGHGGSMFPLYTAPKPAPAPLSDDAKDAARYRWLRATTNFATNSQGERIDVRNQPEKWDAAIDAAMAAQGGKV